jgi:hypothetical protein
MPRIVTGPEATRRLHDQNAMQERRDKWPYPWLCPPDDAEPRNPSNSILAPALGTLTEILAFTVPTGFQFALTGIVQVFVGAGYIPGSQDILWVVDVDAPIGVASVEGFPLPDLNNLVLPLGGYSGSNAGALAALGGFTLPWRFKKPHIIKPNQVLRSKCFLPTLNPLTGAPNGISPGSPNLLVSMFEGFTWPAT